MESPVGSTASPVRCSPTKQASGFSRRREGRGTETPWNRRALQLPTFPLLPTGVRVGVGGGVQLSSARLLLARDERTPEETAARKRDRAGLRPTAVPACGIIPGFPSPSSSQSLGPVAPARHAPPTGCAASALPCYPRALPFPPPAADSDGLGLGLPAARRELGPAGPARRRPTRNPTSCSIPPQGPGARVLETRLKACVRGLHSSPFWKVFAGPATGCSLCVI